jgi:hypothetical protein
MSPTEALDLLDSASKEVTGNREFHISLIEAIRTLREAVEVLK